MNTIDNKSHDIVSLQNIVFLAAAAQGAAALTTATPAHDSSVENESAICSCVSAASERVMWSKERKL
jgi:hypothetical protein